MVEDMEKPEFWPKPLDRNSACIKHNSKTTIYVDNIRMEMIPCDYDREEETIRCF